MLTIRTRYRAAADGGGRIVATGAGRTATVRYDHALSTWERHERAARTLADRIDATAIVVPMGADARGYVWAAAHPLAPGARLSRTFRTSDGGRVVVRLAIRTRAGTYATTNHGTVVDPVEISLQAEVYAPRARTPYAAGQCREELPRDDRDGLMQAMRYPRDALRIGRIWDRWHLNAMQAGCDHQSPTRDEAGRYSAEPCEHTGYRYGSAWLVEPVPTEILAELAALFGA